MKRLILLFLLAINCYAHGQITISGTVIGTNKTSIVGATVMIVGSFDGTITDSQGHYQFNTGLKGEQTILIEEIRLFYSMEKGTYLNTINNRNYVLEYPLEQIMDMLNPNDYFKISRKYIVRIDAAKEIIAHSNSRLKLKIDGFETESNIVAREKVGAFKAWLDQ